MNYKFSPSCCLLLLHSDHFLCFFSVLSGSYVTFNDFSVIWWRCLDVAGSSMLNFRVLPHWNIPPETLDMIFHPVTLYWHWAHQFWFEALLPSCWTPRETAASTISLSLWYHSAGDRTHNLTVTKRTFYGLSRCPNLRCSKWKILLPMVPLFFFFFFFYIWCVTQLAFFINLQRAVTGLSG